MAKRGFWDSFARGYAMGDRMVKDWDAAQEERGLADAYTQGQGLGAVDPAEYEKYASQFAESNPEAAAAYREAAKANYVAPSVQERRRTGLGAQANFLSSTGKTAKAGALYDQMDQMDLRGLQKKSAELSIDKAEREGALEKREAALLAQWEDPHARLMSMYNADEGAYGVGNNAGKRANYKALPDGGAIVWQTGEDGSMRGVAKRFTPEQVKGEATKMMLADLAAVNPGKYLGKAIEAGAREQDIALRREQIGVTANYQDRMAGVAERNAATTEQYRKDMVRLQGMRGAGVNKAADRESAINYYAQAILDAGEAKTPEEARMKAIQLHGRTSLGKLGIGSQRGPVLSFKDYTASYGTGDAQKDLQAYQAFLLSTLTDEELTERLGAIPQGGGKVPPAVEPKAPPGPTLRERYEGLVPPGGGTREIPTEDIKRFFRYGLSGRPPFSPNE